MGKVVDIKFGNGRIVYNGAIDPTPTTTQKSGDVTINNMGSPGVPGNYETSFMLTVKCEEGGIEFTNVFHWTDVFVAENADVPYRQIEDKGARNLAPALRAVADLIDKEIERFDASNLPAE